MRSCRPHVALLFGCTLLAGVATAAPPLPPPRSPDDPAAQEAAKGHYQAAQVYYDRGDYKRALNEFREAARDLDRPEFDFNIARCYERLGDAAKAAVHYDRYLAAAHDAPDRKELEAHVATLRAHTGALVVVSKEPGAQLLVDEEPIAASQLGQPLPVTEGKHRLVSSKEGFLARTVEVEIVAGQRSEVAIDPIVPAPQQVVVVQPQPTQPPSRAGSKALIGVVVGVAVAVVAAGVVTAVVLATQPSGPDPYKGNVSPGVVTVNP